MRSLALILVLCGCARTITIVKPDNRVRNRSLHPLTATGVGIAVLGAATLIAGGVAYAFSTPSVNPDVARCEQRGDWFCGFGESIGGISLMAVGGAEIVIGGGMALGTMKRSDQ